MTKKAIITTHDGREATIVTKASNVLFEDGQTAQDILNDRQDTMITPIITTSTSMSKVGQGDSVDYSANVVNGAYESMVLKGNTKVNLIQESSSQDVVLPYEFTDGQYVTINDTKETGALGVELKGQTLVNIASKGVVLAFTQTTSDFSVKTTETYYEITANRTSDTHSHVNTVIQYTPKVGTEFVAGKTYTFFSDKDCRVLHGVYHNNSLKVYNKHVFTFTPTIDANSLNVYYNNNFGTETTVTYKVPKNIVILEGDYTNVDIPYFEGMQSVQVPSVTTVGKNLFDAKQVSSSSNFGVTLSKNGDTLRLSGTPSRSYGSHNINVKLKKGKTYSFQVFINGVAHRGTGYKMWGHNSDSLIVNIFSGDKFTPLKDVLSTYLVWEGLTVGKEITIDNIEIQIEESPTPTTYEPYKSTTLTLPEEITLRGIGNVKDTLNTVTGEYTQRIGEVVLDGSDDETIGKASDYGFADYVNSEYSAFRVSSSSMTNKHHELNDQKNIIKTDKFNVIASWLIHQGTPQEGITNYHDTAITISILKSKLTENTVAGFKQYLQQNPITVQYRLATPITKKLDLTFTDQDNAPTAKLSTYNTTTRINASSQEGSLIPTLSHVNPSYPVILKPSTKYSIVADSYSNGHTNSPINFNLGGATVSTTVGNRVSTVTTPSTLTSEKLVMSGRGNKLNNVMVIEGEVVGDEPYFEGICDSKSPILSNVGKNLFDGESRVGYYDTDKGTYVSTPTMKQCCNTTPIQVSGGTKYSFLLPEGDMGSGRTFLYDSKMKFITSIINADVRYVITTTQNTKYINFHFDNATPELLSKVQLEEGSATTTYEPYKSNILSANGDKVELTEDMFEQGAFGYIGGTTREDCVNRADASLKNYRIRSKQLIKINPNASYRILISNKDYMVGLQGFDDKQISIGYDTYWKSDDVITTPSNMHYCNILIKKSNDKTITPSDFDNANIEIREIDKTIVLRSLPNGVCDTLDLVTGEYVQRIGEVVFGANEKESTWTYNDNGSYKSIRRLVERCVKVTTAINNQILVNCDKYIPVRYNVVWTIENMVSVDTSGNIVFCGDSITDKTKWIESLKTNPITVQYQLATPITTTIDLQGSPYTYKDGHIQLTSGSIEQSLTPIIEYSVPTNRNGQIRSNQKMVEKHQKELDKLQAIILANLVNSQYNQTLTTLNYELSRV